MNKLLESNIQTLNGVYQKKACSSTDLIKACFNRITKTKICNAFINLTPEIAERQAKKCDERIENCASLGPLDGVPIAIKDNFCISSIKTTCGSKMLKNFVPTYNATVYERLSNAGAILIGKTNMDQFAMGSGTVDSIYGPCRNIHGLNSVKDDFFICGGSSGGSALAVATGACFASLGSDTGGSVRNPAAYCGVVGLKPTYGLVSRYGLIPLVHSMDVPGILTRTVDDSLKVLNVIAGPDSRDSTTLKRKFQPFSVEKNPKVVGLKVGIPREYFCEGLSTEMHQTWKLIGDVLEEGGATVKQVSMPHTQHSIVCYSILNQCEVASNMACYDGIEFGYRAAVSEQSTENLYAMSRSLGFNNVVKTRIITGNYFLLQRNYEKYFNKALKVRRLIANDFDEVFQDVHVLLTPTTLTTAPVYSQFTSMTNRDQCSMQDFGTQPANMAGVPAVSIPIQLSSNNMPIAVQLIGRNLNERILLNVAKYIENAVQFPSLNLNI